jgi:group I intron endonuclease
MSNCGIYKIENFINGHFYIGSAINLPRRKWTHFSQLRTNTHKNQHLQRAFTKYGEEAFRFIPVLFCDKDNLLFYEQLCIDGLKPVYNIAKVAGASMRGLKRTPESLAKASAKLKGRKFSEEHKAKISAAHVGKIQGPHSEEHKKKIGDKNRGRKHTAASIEKMRMVQSGKIISKEQRIKNGTIHSKAVERIDPVTGEMKEYSSITSAAKENFNISNVARCCKGERKIHKGYYWAYINTNN